MCRVQLKEGLDVSNRSRSNLLFPITIKYWRLSTDCHLSGWILLVDPNILARHETFCDPIPVSPCYLLESVCLPQMLQNPTQHRGSSSFSGQSRTKLVEFFLRFDLTSNSRHGANPRQGETFQMETTIETRAGRVSEITVERNFAETIK